MRTPNRTRLARATRLAAAVLGGGALAAAAGCTSPAGSSGGSGSTGSGPPAGAASSAAPSPADIGAHPAAAWPSYGRDAARSGVAAGVAAPGPLTASWRVRLDGAVYGQPLLVGTLVVAATENDSLYGLDQATGKVAWRTHVGTPVPLADLPCGNIDPLGITSTPVYDQASGLVYAVAETTGYHHLLVGVSVRDGSIQVERDIPAPDGQPRYDQQRPALTIGGGRVYVVVGIPLGGAGPLISYVVPTPREGAVWGTAGPVTGPDGTMYVSVGNGSETGGRFDGSDSVTALSPGLRRTGVFAPSTWADDNAHDLDLGSTQPALLPDGMLLADGKRGTAYLVDPAHLGGVGGQVAQAQVCEAYGGAAVRGSVVYEPCAQGGLAAVSTTGNQIRVLWRGPAQAQGSPVIGGGRVWVTDYQGGTLYELDQSTGATKASLSLGTGLPHFSSMSMTGRHAFLSTMKGVIAVGGV